MKFNFDGKTEREREREREGGKEWNNNCDKIELRKMNEKVSKRRRKSFGGHRKKSFFKKR